MQNQANFLFTYFGQPERRVERVKIDAASYPAAWQLVMGINVGDLVQLEDWQIGGGGSSNIYRVTEIKRTFSFGARDTTPEATVELTCDYEPPEYWSLCTIVSVFSTPTCRYEVRPEVRPDLARTASPVNQLRGVL